MSRIYSIFFSLAISLGTLATLVAAQDAALVLDSSADYTFGEELRFSLRAQNASGMEQLTLVFRPELSPNIYELDVPFQPGEVISVTQSIHVNNIDIRPFSDVTYSWEYKTAAGTQKVPDQTVSYEDDRYPWQKMTRENVTAHWVAEPPPFGQSILDITDESLLQLLEMVPLEKVDPIDLYLYPSMVELQEVISENEAEDIQKSQLDLGIILLARADEQTAEIDLQQSIPYELAQLFLYRAAGDQYTVLPWWLQEGIAGSVQSGSNSGSDLLLAEAIKNGTTIPFSDLCTPPPDSWVQQNLASLQSVSFIRFLIERRSSGTISDLLSAYIHDSSCEQGIEQVLDKSLDALEQEWLSGLQEPTPVKRLVNDMAIWIIILLAGTLLILFLISATRQKE